MQLSLFFLLATLIACVAAWTKDDYEIFDLVSAVEASEGKGTTFYSWLGVPSTASTGEIAKAYRKKSIQLHPDKNPNDKKAHERFARLGIVSSILRNTEKRERYDFFYKNGVPKWRGTGYYYLRFRPGLGTVLTFLIIVTSTLHYVIQGLNYKRDLKRINFIAEQARIAAWGTKLIPTSEGQRKVKVNLGGPPRLDEDGNVVAGKMVDMVVEGHDVYILEPDGNLLPVDSNTAIPPSLKRTWFISLMIRLYERMTAGKNAASGDNTKATTDADLEDSDDASASASDIPGSGAATPKEGTVSGAKKGRAAAAELAGGRRRKAVRKR
ncbi:DnaJ-domain-containing protein [Laetiporus sulphureus 93-53]|uniref:DnaJ-domain-containing protein n=1 Tax=Laetiporus sulphureus 93-53 TaxID=1314785 RepID=A0A165I1L8_9APHY|nr:DnaJ-domain-containing protein [Laetiporus sulphureus 93-53]KZT12474.1 DnaJ-domain-containing protein [Laetiporus sulphureus 93-53]